MKTRIAASHFLWLACFGFAQPSHAIQFLSPDVSMEVIRQANSAGHVTTPIAGQLGTPEQVIQESSGDWLVADSAGGRILRFPRGGGASSQVGDNVPGVTSLVVWAGSLFVVSSSDRTIRELNGDVFVTIATLPVGTVPQGMTASANGDLFVADNQASGKIWKRAGNGQVTEFSSPNPNDNLVNPYAVVFDHTGKLHATDAKSGGRVVSFNPQGKTQEVLSGAGAVRGLAFDEADRAHFVTTGGELRQVTSKTSSSLIASGFGDGRQLTIITPTVEAVVRTGMRVDEPSDAVLRSFGSPALGPLALWFKGAMRTGVEGVTRANATAIWSVDFTGSMNLIARQGSLAPGDLASNQLTLLGNPVANRLGKIAFIAGLKVGAGDATSANARAVFSDAAGSLSPVLRRGDPVPGAGIDPAATFNAFRQLVLPADSGPAVLATIRGPGLSSANNLGLWSMDSSGQWDLVLRKGDEIEVLGKSRRLTRLSLFSSVPLGQGQGRHAGLNRRFVLLAGFADGARAILQVAPGQTPIILAAKGESVWDGPDEPFFATLRSPAIDPLTSEAAFQARMTTGPQVSKADATAVFMSDNGEFDIKARRFFGAPQPSGALFTALADPLVSEGGGLAILGKTRTPSGTSLTPALTRLWQDVDDGLKLAVSQGDPVPDIREAGQFRSFSCYVLPKKGGVVFAAKIVGRDIPRSRNQGIWASDGFAGLDLLLRKGGSVRVEGFTKTVASFAVFAGVSGLTGQARHFNEAGDVAALTKFTDKSRAILVIRRP